MPIRCDIVTQDRPLFSGEADMVIAPASEGVMGILPHHTPLLTTLSYGILVVKQGEKEQAFAIAGGIMEVLPDAVTVLADVGERVEEIDVARAEAAKARAEELLKQAPGERTDEYLKAMASLRRSQLRLDAARKSRK
ncbi:MAG: ATP synthase F1 subunit epsilon [Anaerolineales bacterium]|nr:ATP synthase F1 subunit epsilon [Anaerolineales bacterium]